MALIHIALVGGQPAPIYNSITALKPDYVVFIYSKESKWVFENVAKEIDIPFDGSIELDPNDSKSAEMTLKCAKGLAEKYSQDTIIVDISGGLKSWSHIFGITFNGLPNSTVVYIDQNNVLWDYNKMSGTKLDLELDMLTHFRLYGNSIENNYKRFKDYTDSDNDALTKIEEIRKFNYKDFNRLLTVLSKPNNNSLRFNKFGKFILDDTNSYVEWEKTTPEKDGFVRICLYKKGEIKEVQMESPNVVDLAFNSGWFEYKVAKLFSSLDYAKEIYLNCKFPYRKGIDKNEVDIIINTGDKILFVECKTQITTPTDIDKFRSVIKTYGGMGSKGIFVTDSPMDDIIKKKCEEHEISTFSLSDSHLGLSPEKALDFLLRPRLSNINIK